MNSERYQRLWPSGLFADITLQVEGRSFHVHRAVLVTVSDYFYTLLTQFGEAGSEALEINEVNAEAFSDLIAVMLSF